MNEFDFYGLMECLYSREREGGRDHVLWSDGHTLLRAFEFKILKGLAQLVKERTPILLITVGLQNTHSKGIIKKAKN